MYTRKHCIFCGKKLPKKIYINTPQANGYCSDKCLLDAEKMIGKEKR